MITTILLAIAGLLAPRVTSKQGLVEAAAEVICTEAGYSATREADRLRGHLIMHVLDKRGRAAQRQHPNRGWRKTLERVIFARHQWGHNCKVRHKELPGWLKDQARRLVERKVHFSPSPTWLTDDVLYVVAEHESKRLGPVWGGRRCLVRVEWGLAFYGDCGVAR